MNSSCKTVGIYEIPLIHVLSNFLQIYMHVHVILFAYMYVCMCIKIHVNPLNPYGMFHFSLHGRGQAFIVCTCMYIYNGRPTQHMVQLYAVTLACVYVHICTCTVYTLCTLSILSHGLKACDVSINFLFTFLACVVCTCASIS